MLLVEDAGETCLVARSGDEGMVERVWSILVSIVVSIPACHAGDPGTIPGREASFCSHLLFCSSALLLFCSSALLPPPTLLLFCSSALLFFAAFFPAVRAPQPTSLMLPTLCFSLPLSFLPFAHSWRIGTSAAVESDSPTRTKIDTCTAPYSSLVEDAGETCLVARSGDEGMVERVWSLVEDAGERCLVARSGEMARIGRGCGRNVFGGAEWRRGYGRARVVVCVGGGRSIGQDAGERCLVARSGDEGMVERVWSWRIGTSAAVESDSPTRTLKIDTCTAHRTRRESELARTFALIRVTRLSRG
ncbi:hypothetical protein P3T76_016444 [Phytophthora citrophthora]|uniref:Uncharacterized protein n=1 Tax=Phytophthora citrophthora TaxID=4793 RepID=A0AAD9FXJ2_9STRA|nr:hypothetical protein P3T76_016444 [Phytophthora citrophthora]